MASKLTLAVMRSHFILKCILLFNMVPPVVSMPGYYDYDRLPPMHDGQDNKLMWDGIPSPYFMESFYQPLQNALGSVAENGHTLLVTAFDNDAGGLALGPLRFGCTKLCSRYRSNQREHSMTIEYDDYLAVS